MKILLKSIRFLHKLIEPKSKDEDLKRREFILNVLLLGSILVSGIAVITILIQMIRLGSAYRGSPPEITLIIFLVFCGLYLLSRKGFFILSSYILLGIYFISATYTAYNWGVDLPMVLLIYALIIIMSGILISTRFAFITTLITSAVIAIIGYLQINNIINPDLYWTEEIFKMEDIATYIAILGVIVAICWLSNREIEKSLKRARTSEGELKKERDLLEVKVEERTKELRKLQMEKMEQLYRSAEFGRLSSGLFHDLVNPLTAVSLSLEQVKDKDGNELFNTRGHLARALSAAKQMENFIIAVRKQLTKEENETYFSLSEEINQIKELLSYKAKKANVEFIFFPGEDIRTFGDSIKFSQVVTNIISNAIDAYEEIEQFGKRKEVLLNLGIKDGLISLTVQDWAKGIPLENINKIFEPFFTTKKFGRDLGIGLPMAKNIIEKDFKGFIKVGSKIGEGTTFTLEFPKKEGPELKGA